MAVTYYCRTTDAGLIRINAAANDGVPFTIVQMAVGDAGGADPAFDGTETALINERARLPVHSVTIPPGRPTVREVLAILPGDIGGFTIREFAFFDDAGHLVAIGKYPPTVRPLEGEGFSSDLSLRIRMEVTRGDVTIQAGGSQVFVTQNQLMTVLNQYRDTWYENRW